jgi:hypothetical protein
VTTTEGKPMSEAEPDATVNGTSPSLGAAIAALTEHANMLRAEEDSLRAALDAVREQRGRLDRAVAALTAPKRERTQPTRGKVGSRPSQADTRYPAVGEAKQAAVLAALKTFDRPVPVSDLRDMPNLDMAGSTIGNALAHLRARGLVRWAGKTKGGGHTYAAFEDGSEGED